MSEHIGIIGNPPRYKTTIANAIRALGSGPADFVNIVRHAKPASPLRDEEIDAVADSIHCAIESYAPNARRGTFILDGQKHGEEAQCILRFNLPGGLYRRQFFRSLDRTSDQLAEDSIDELLALPGESRYAPSDSEARQGLRQSIQSARDVKSGIWRDGELRVLVLNTTHGRFLISCFIESDDDDFVAEMVLHTVVQVLARLSVNDPELYQSIATIAAAGSDQDAANQHQAYGLVSGLFASDSRSAICSWKSWRDAHLSELTPYFE